MKELARLLLSAPSREDADSLLEAALNPVWEKGAGAVAKALTALVFEIVDDRDSRWKDVCYEEIKRERSGCSLDAQTALRAYLAATSGAIDQEIMIESVRDALYARFGSEAPPYGAPEDETKH